MQDVFENIYASGIWGRGSGDGSAPNYARRYQEILQAILVDLKIQTVLDLGCGDWTNGFSQHVKWANIHYTGIEVVRNVVEKNQKAFGSPTIKFQQGDIVAGELPSADLILVKDVMQHWSNASVIRFLPKLKNFKFALITNDLLAAQPRALNQDVPDGDFRPVDLMAPPFSVPGAEILLYSNATYSPLEPIRWIKKVILIRN
jgi:SAM-dependent methyltransferase